MSNSTPLRRPVLDTGLGFSPDLSIAIELRWKRWIPDGA